MTMYKIIKSIFGRNLKISRNLLSSPNVSPKVVNRSIMLRCGVNKSTSQNVYLLDEDDNRSKSEIASHVNKYSERTYTCGELNVDHVGQSVTLCGWLEYQRMNKFLVLRDSYGETQLLVKDDDSTTRKLLEDLPLESIIEVKGTVLSRPVDMRNAKQKTGDIEVLVDTLNILNKAKPNLPFNIREFQKAKESLRMQYRYLDLRFPFMQRNLRVRSQMLMRMREFLVNKSGFVDVETPTLFKATPGGAQEFVVPTRFPGQFYSLVQSPQQFKQMLMAGAIDRYFQIARCYRDETSRPDRQPEFTQLDIEMSFTSLEHIFSLVEDMLGHCWPTFLGSIPKKFPRLSYSDAMEQYGTDQPDIRFDFKLQNCTDLVYPNTKFKNINNFGTYAIVIPKEYGRLGKSMKDAMAEMTKQYSSVKLVQTKITSTKDWKSKITKLLNDQSADKIANFLNLTEGCVLFLSCGNKNEVLNLLGKIRLEFVDRLENLGTSVRQKGMHLLWVVDFPLFEPANDGSNSLQSVHHPFTSPHPEDIHLLEASPLQVRALSFDLVLNGNEIGGGSVRIHDPRLQQRIFEMLQIDATRMRHILDMLSSGCPPHGGIALGLDRLMSKILKTNSIRDVIAFPKSFEGRDPLSGAPSAISEADQKLYHIKSVYDDK